MNFNIDDKIYSKITNFGKLEETYFFTNEDMHLYEKENLKDKKVLTITSSGDHALNSILNGAEIIDSFDINLYSKYISALKIAMIKRYNFHEFYRKIEWIILNKNFRYNKKDNIIEDIKNYLSYDEYKFLSYLDDIFIKNPNAFYKIINLSVMCGLNKYENQKDYKILRKNLNNVKITYYDCDILDIHKELNYNKYDVIYISNVLEHILCSGTFKYIKNYQTVIKILDELMYPNSKIYGYDFSFIGDYKANLPKELFYNYRETLGRKEKIEEKAFVLHKLK